VVHSRAAGWTQETPIPNQGVFLFIKNALALTPERSTLRAAIVIPAEAASVVHSRASFSLSLWARVRPSVHGAGDQVYIYEFLLGIYTSFCLAKVYGALCIRLERARFGGAPLGVRGRRPGIPQVASRLIRPTVGP
jgi:hypothetical protein